MPEMSPRQRLIRALAGQQPDRLPATTHHLMPYFLDRYLGGTSVQGFFDLFGLDAIHWTYPQVEPSTDQWRVMREELPSQDYRTVRYRIITPRGALTMVKQSNQYTDWLVEHPIKQKVDIELLADFLPPVLCDVATVNREAAAFGERGIVRGAIPGFPLFGQPGCWQDAACLIGTERLILATFDDPGWVHELLTLLLARKLAYVRSLAGAAYDLIELGGGDASTTVISPKLFMRFVAPYDAQLIAAAHAVGQRIAYHTCGGMMPILEALASMGPDALETFTPRDMGGDADLAEAKRRIGDRVCMIGGFDQAHHFFGCRPEETRAAVRCCFDAAGAGGGFILSPSDHFFDADPELLRAYAEAARACIY
jgi:uroporphyrinogen-III decarboxylase